MCSAQELTQAVEASKAAMRELHEKGYVRYEDLPLETCRSRGMMCGTAHDGPTAVQAAIDDGPDVMLLDIGLPGLNGYEVAKRIRQQPDLKNVVLVALTG